jgi:hypothetical protein
MQVFPADKQKNPYTKKFDKTPEDYNGAACPLVIPFAPAWNRLCLLSEAPFGMCSLSYLLSDADT